MDDMEFARYSCDIRKVLKNMKNFPIMKSIFQHCYHDISVFSL